MKIEKDGNFCYLIKNILLKLNIFIGFCKLLLTSIYDYQTYNLKKNYILIL